MVRRTRLPADIRARLPRLADALRDDPHILAVYLFGSLARGTEGPLSDVDVAILVAEPVELAEIGRLELAYTGAALAALGIDEASVVILNTAPLALRHRVIREGRVLLDRVPRARREFEVRSEELHLDFKPVLDAYDDELLRQLQHPHA